MKSVVVGTAGHIDHGKSALILALTGIDPDRLEEEKQRGITIDLGFAHLDLDRDIRVAFVDVPGHERFVKNMLAGASGIDIVMLIVAADESIKPQTREHFDICRLLGLQKGLVVLTKSDLVEPEMLDLVRLEVRDLVVGSFLEDAPIVAVSARTGDGLEHLKKELTRLSLAVSPRPTDSPLRLPIDRAFVIKGFGTVVTGTLAAGKIQKDSEAEVFPLGRRVRVRGIEVHNRAADFAVAGQRTAVNLSGIEARELRRGMVLAAPDLFAVTDRLDCSLTLLPYARPLKHRTPVHFHCGTEEMIAEVFLLEAKELAPGARGYVQLRLQAGGLFFPRERFIIRQYSPVTTIGGGTILDNHPPKHKFTDPQVPRYLKVAEHGEPLVWIEQIVQRAGEISLTSVVARTGWSATEVLRLAQVLQSSGRLKLLGQPSSLLVHSEHFSQLRQEALAELEKFHQANPLLSGIGREDLRGRMLHRASPIAADSSSLLFVSLLQSLAAEGQVEVNGEIVRRAGHDVQLSAEELMAKEQITRAFAEAGLAVPSPAEVLRTLSVDRMRAEKILQLLLREKTLIKVSKNLIFHQAALARLREMLAQHKDKSPHLDVATFKALTGLSRKYAVPLLEYLDREQVTRRVGEKRIIL